MRELLGFIEAIAMIVAIVFMLLFFVGQFTSLLTPQLHAFTESYRMVLCIGGAAVTVELSRFIRTRVFD